MVDLLWCNVALADEYVKRVKWKTNSEKAYKDCWPFGFLCKIYMSTSSDKSKAEIGSYLKVYNKSGEEVDNFEVKTIYYEASSKRCFISKIPKEEPHTYLTVHDCVVYDNKSEKNRKKSTIQLSCEIKKIHFIKKYDGTTVGVWYDEQHIKKNFPKELTIPVIIETNKDSHAIWIDGNGTIAWDHNKTGLSYLTEQNANKEGFVTLSLTSISYEDLKFFTEASMLIKKDDSRYNYSFTNKPEISSKGYGTCKKLKWDLK